MEARGTYSVPESRSEGVRACRCQWVGGWGGGEGGGIEAEATMTGTLAGQHSLLGKKESVPRSVHNVFAEIPLLTHRHPHHDVAHEFKLESRNNLKHGTGTGDTLAPDPPCSRS
jgi:hypothetical protein